MFPAVDGSTAGPQGTPGPVDGAVAEVQGHRHPLDPDPVRSSKATAVQWLGIVAVLFSPVLAGVLPAVVALVLARDAANQMRASAGFLTGARSLLWGVRLARLALWIAAAMIVFGVVVALLRAGGPMSSGVQYGPDVN